MDKVFSKCPVCKKESTPDYHTNQGNFCQVNFSVGGNTNIPYYGANFKICTDCATLASTEDNGTIAKIKEMLDPIVAADKAM